MFGSGVGSAQLLNSNELAMHLGWFLAVMVVLLCIFLLLMHYQPTNCVLTDSNVSMEQAAYYALSSQQYPTAVSLQLPLLVSPLLPLVSDANSTVIRMLKMVVEVELMLLLLMVGDSYSDEGDVAGPRPLTLSKLLIHSV